MSYDVYATIIVAIQKIINAFTGIYRFIVFYTLTITAFFSWCYYNLKYISNIYYLCAVVVAIFAYSCLIYAIFIATIKEPNLDKGSALQKIKPFAVFIIGICIGIGAIGLANDYRLYIVMLESNSIPFFESYSKICAPFCFQQEKINERIKERRKILYSTDKFRFAPERDHTQQFSQPKSAAAAISKKADFAGINADAMDSTSCNQLLNRAVDACNSGAYGDAEDLYNQAMIGKCPDNRIVGKLNKLRATNPTCD